MSRTVLALLAVVVMVAPGAGAQILVGLGFPGDASDFSDEPDTSVPDPYTSDPNGIQDARHQGDPAPVKILNAKWMSGDGSEFGTTVDLGKLLQPTGGRTRGILPLVPGEFVAFYGRWTDLDGNGRLNPNRAGPPVFVNADASNACDSQELRTNDPDGLLAPLDVANPVSGGTVGISYRCVDTVEWAPITSSEVVAYLTPGYATNTFVGAPTPRPGDPDVVFREYVIDGNPRYLAPGDVGAFVFVDNGAFETMVMETFANPVNVPGGVRTREARSGEPTDVDTYLALDPAVESLYRIHVKPRYATLGCDPERLGACGPTVPGVSAARVTGPVTATVLPPVARELPPYAYSDAPHSFFDVRMELALYLPLVGGGDDQGGGEVSSDADGTANAPLLMGVYGNLGAWFDENGDGWIGAPTADEGCGDVYDCGATPDPNDYASDEWTGICRPYVGVEAQRHPYGEINATITSSTGAWGRGVYVLTDHAFYGLGFGFMRPFGFGGDDPDWYYTPGSLAFPAGPYDDIVLDGTDGRIDQLVLTGPIPTNLNCVEEIEPGYYRSYDHFVFLDGGNVGYAVTVTTDSFDVDFRDEGVDQIETVEDSDTLPSM